jgi:prepilin-type N-terminal cleavage/methylation domain-containing protein
VEVEDRRAGVTLVELMAVLALIGILAGLVTASFGRVLARAQTTSALHQLAADISYTRMLAVRGGSRVELRFTNEGSCGDPQSGRFSADGYRITVRDPAPRVVRVARLQSSASGVCLESNNDTNIVFGSRGLLLPFENRTVWSRRKDVVDSLTVSVLGRVRRRF